MASRELIHAGHLPGSSESPSTTVLGAKPTRFDGGSGPRVLTAAALFATLLLGCGSAGAEPQAEQNGSDGPAEQSEEEPADQPTEGDIAVGDEECPPSAVCAEGYVIDRPDAASGDGPAAIVDPGPCRDDGACAEGFFVGDSFHAVSCGPVRPELVTDEVVASGTWAGGMREVRAIAGVDPAVLLAINIPGGECVDGDVALSDYSMVLVGTSDTSSMREAVCTAAVDEHLERNGC